MHHVALVHKDQYALRRMKVRRREDPEGCLPVKVPPEPRRTPIKILERRSTLIIVSRYCGVSHVNRSHRDFHCDSLIPAALLL